VFELPEVVTLARQLSNSVVGQTVADVVLTEPRPKFLFVTPKPGSAFRAALIGREIRCSRSAGKWLFLDLSDGKTLLIGEFGGRLLHTHAGSETPTKQHLAIALDDESSLSLTIQMWGFVGALSPDELRDHPYAGRLGPEPLSDAFSETAFNRILDNHAGGDNEPIKAFLTHEANVCGIGNGYLQDILFRARLSPRRRVADIARDERAALHEAVQKTMSEAIALEGRDTEVTLYGKHGRYTPILDKRTVGIPCPVCSTPIKKTQYLGGSCYLCPTCQT